MKCAISSITGMVTELPNCLYCCVRVVSLAREEAEGKLLVLRPPEKLPIGRTEKDPEKLRRVYEIGRTIAQIRIAEIKAFLS